MQEMRHTIAESIRFYADPFMGIDATLISIIAGLILLFGIVVRAWVRLRQPADGVRLMVLGVLYVALLNPHISHTVTTPLPDVALVIVDGSPSQSVDNRLAQSDAALKSLLTDLQGIETMATQVHTATKGTPNAVMETLVRAARTIPDAQYAGAFVITDGQVGNTDDALDDSSLAMLAAKGPVHTLLSGTPDARNRRVRLISHDSTVHAWQPVGEDAAITFAIEQSLPPSPHRHKTVATTTVNIMNGTTILQTIQVPIGIPHTVHVPITHAGMHHITIRTAPLTDEISGYDNMALVSIKGIRERLRVLLVSGNPHMSGKMWRNLLKSDPAIDLVHFTILRPPEKSANAPAQELALIDFPVHELFETKLHAFDLVILDRYRVRGILPDAYFRNIRDYVTAGGALLIGIGTEFASPLSLAQTPLRDIMPLLPPTQDTNHTGNRERATEHGITPPFIIGHFRPRPDENAKAHPVIAGLFGPKKPVGRWFRLLKTVANGGTILLRDEAGNPLLATRRIVPQTTKTPAQQAGGRVALLASDQLWLWERGYDGGGPYGPLLRRLTHWLVKEPALETERLLLLEDATGQLQVERHSRQSGIHHLTITTPDGTPHPLDIRVSDAGGGTHTGIAPFSPAPAPAPAPSPSPSPSPAPAPPSTENTAPLPMAGLYTLTDGGLQTVHVIGQNRLREFHNLDATALPMTPLSTRTGGGIFWLHDGIPGVRPQRADDGDTGRRVLHGGTETTRWMGVLRHHTHKDGETRHRPLLSGSVWAGLIILSLILLWMTEAGTIPPYRRIRKQRRPPIDPMNKG